jgi:hypothetical protein
VELEGTRKGRSQGCNRADSSRYPTFRGRTLFPLSALYSKLLYHGWATHCLRGFLVRLGNTRNNPPFLRRSWFSSCCSLVSAYSVIIFLCLCVVHYRRRPPCYNCDHVSTSLSATLDCLSFAIHSLVYTHVYLAVPRLGSQRNRLSSHLVAS